MIIQISPKLSGSRDLPQTYRQVCYKVSLCENRQRQSSKAFIDLTIRAKMIGGDVPFYARIWRILTHPPIVYLFSPVAPQP